MTGSLAVFLFAAWFNLNCILRHTMFSTMRITPFNSIAYAWALPTAFHHCQCFILFNCAVLKVLPGCILISVSCGLLIVVMRCFTHANSQLCLYSICVSFCTWLCCFALPLLACVNFSAVLYDKAVYLCNHLNRHFHLKFFISFI